MYKPDLDKLNKKLKSLGSGKFLKLQEGDNKIRFLPPTEEGKEFYVELTQHHGFNDGDRARAYPCLEAMRGKKCPICVFYRKAIDEGDKDVANKVAPKTIFMSNVVDRSDGNIKILSYNQKLLKAILGYLVDDEYGPEILDPEKGLDFTIKREGQGFKTRYGDPRISPKPKPVGVRDWEDKVHNLEAEIDYKSYDDLADLIESEYPEYLEEWGLEFGKKEKDDNGDDEETEEEQDEAPRGSKSGGKSKPKAKEDDDEGEDEADEDDDEEESKPASKGKAKPVTKKTKEEPEEIEDEDDLEAFLAEDDDDEVEIEDEEPKPAKAKVKGKKK